MARRSEQDRSENAKPLRYGGKLLIARASMVWEQFWRGLWPALSVVALFLALALLGVLPLLPGWLHAIALAAFLGAAAFLLWNGVRRISVPDADAGRRRLERVNALPHRPLQTLRDNLAEGLGDADAEALWREHRRRVAESTRDIRAGLPSPEVAARDPMALRFAAALLAVVAVSVAWPDAGKRLREAVTPAFSGGAAVPRPALEVWITPPAYTGEAPVFPRVPAAGTEPDGSETEPATAAAAPIRVPAGSLLTARLANAPGKAELVLGVTRKAFERVDAGNASVEAPIEVSSRLAVEIDGDVLADWRIEAIPDRPPTIAFAKPPQATERKALMLVYKSEDDYGLERVWAEIRRTYERGTVMGKEVETIDLALPRPGAKAAEAASYHDLTPHRWAGLPVAIRLAARDGAGQTATGEDARITLPERTFRHPGRQADHRAAQAPDHRARTQGGDRAGAARDRAPSRRLSGQDRHPSSRLPPPIAGSPTSRGTARWTASGTSCGTRRSGSRTARSPSPSGS